MYLTDERIEPELFVNEPVDPACGGSVFFAGRVRNHHEGREVLRMEYEAYEILADKEINAIVLEAKRTYGVESVQVKHRIGKLEIGDVAILITVSSAHRAEAFEACRYVIDQIKERVPIWKREYYADGTNEWVLCSHQTKEIPAR